MGVAKKINIKFEFFFFPVELPPSFILFTDHLYSLFAIINYSLTSNEKATKEMNIFTCNNKSGTERVLTGVIFSGSSL